MELGLELAQEPGRHLAGWRASCTFLLRKASRKEGEESRNALYAHGNPRTEVLPTVDPSCLGGAGV